MGNQCLASTPIEHYQSYFEDLKVSEMKDYWTTMQTHKIKKLFDSVSKKHVEYEKISHLEFQGLVSLLPQIQNFPENQKKRVFEMFDFEGIGFIDWNNFYSMISICYFSKQETLAVLVFLIFDASFSKEVNEAELMVLCECLDEAIQLTEDQGEQIPLYCFDQIMMGLLGGRKTLTLKGWLENGPKYFNFLNFTKFFNIFVEEKLEKNLIKNFNQWNNLYEQEYERYVSYIINFKWFETWKIYVKENYGININNNTKKPGTIKTKKLLEHKGNSSNKKIANRLTLRELKINVVPKKKKMKNKNKNRDENEEEVPEELKNFDFIHGNIGEKPHFIENKVLEGDFEQVLSEQIMENRDYVLISEKIWKCLKRIYGGEPEFRRTGYDCIELYPKILKVFQYSAGIVDYKDEKMKEVSAYYIIEDIFQAIVGSKDEENKKVLFFRTLGMKKWQQVTNLQVALGELTTEVIIFIMVVEERQKQQFFKKVIKTPCQSILEINVGDEIILEHPCKKIDTKMVFIGKNIEGKFILHEPGESYLDDICIVEKQLQAKGKLVAMNEVKVQAELVKSRKKLEQTNLVGIPNTKGLGYVNSCIMHLYYNRNLRQQLSLLKIPSREDSDEEIYFIKVIATLFQDISGKKKIDTKTLQEAIDEIMPDFNNFSADMCQQFSDQFYQNLTAEVQNLKLKNFICQYRIETNRETLCKKCSSKFQEQQSKFFLALPLKNNPEKYYQINYVPYCQSLKTLDIKKYGFKLPATARMEDYKAAFEEVAGISKDTQYLLMEVYANNIVKNYSSAKDEASLDELLLRDSDIIFAYELKVDFTDFINKHYSQKVDYEKKEIKIGQFIDCRNDTRGWIFGKAYEKDFTPYRHHNINMVRVIHKFSKGEHWEVNYDVDQSTIANFPTKSYLNSEQYHLRLQQRYFNEASNNMEICNIPLVVALTSWMRWKQFNYLIYLQLKRFISSDQTEFEDEEEHINAFNSSKTIARNPKQKKMTQKIRLNRFKEYLNGEDFPYLVSIVDYSGRCAVCFKFQKSKVFQGEESIYCVGCPLSLQQPISWQIKVSDVMICIDWKGNDGFKKDVIKTHSSHANMMAIRKNDVQTIENCLHNLLNGTVQPMEQLCCNVETETVVKQQILQFPENLNIFIERIVEQNGFTTILSQHVKFGDQLVFPSGETYRLVGLTSIDGGSNKSNKFRTFINISENQWLQYDGNVVRTIKKHNIDKLTVLNFYYQKCDPTKNDKDNAPQKQKSKHFSIQNVKKQAEEQNDDSNKDEQDQLLPVNKKQSNLKNKTMSRQ